VKHATRLLLIVCACTLVKAQTGSQVRLQINGSQAYAAETVVPLKSAMLLLDTISFDGKSGFVKLQKGQTTMYLVLSNLPVPCEMKDVYDRKRFLQANAPRLLPDLPSTAQDEDFVVMAIYQQHYEPKKVSGPPLADLIGGAWHISDFNYLIPGGGSPKAKDAEQLAGPGPSIVHFSEVFFGLRHLAAGEKGYSLSGKSRAGSWVYLISSESRELYLDPTRREPPFDKSMLDLIRDGDSWTANFDLNGKTFKLSGRVPLHICQPNFVAVN
jgi:hypothetical protein